MSVIEIDMIDRYLIGKCIYKYFTPQLAPTPNASANAFDLVHPDVIAGDVGIHKRSFDSRKGRSDEVCLSNMISS